MSEEKITLLKAVIEDLVSDLFYYDRKEDDELTVEDMKNLSDDEKRIICDTFNKCVMEDIK